MNNTSLAAKQNSHFLLAFAKTLAYITGLFLFAGCLSGQVKAAPSDSGKSDAPGYLEVFSSTQQSQWGEGSTYFLHTGYRIFDATGKSVKWVANHSDSADETPERVELAPGSYVVWAQSDRHGYEKLAIVVRASSNTTLHLEGADRKEKCLAME